MADKTYKLTFTLSDGSTIDAGTFVVPQGERGIRGEQGIQGEPGKDGITPNIGENGNWYLGTTDTGKPSRGAEGSKGPAGDDYVLTEADKAEIVAATVAALPKYDGGVI